MQGSETLTELIEQANQYRKKAIKFINKFVHDYHYAEDIYQDVMAYLVQGDLTYDPSKYNSFKSWFFLATRRRAIDFYRHDHGGRGEKRKVCFRNTEEPQFLEMRQDQKTCEFDAEEITFLKKEISTLDEESRKLLQLHYIEDQTYRTISLSTGMSETAIGNHLFRARNNLRKQLKGKIQAA